MDLMVYVSVDGLAPLEVRLDVVNGTLRFSCRVLDGCCLGDLLMSSELN
jgi:hypothetical protein